MDATERGSTASPSFVQVTGKADVPLAAEGIPTNHAIGVKEVITRSHTLILCYPMDYRTPGFPVLHHLPEFA